MSILKNRIVCLWLIVFLLILFPQEVLSSSTDNKTEEVIKVVLDDNYPPYTFRDSMGNLQGILVDQWALWEKKTGLKVELTGMDWSTAVQKMQAGEFDVIDTIFFNEERDKYLDFTEPYEDINVPIFFVNNISGIANIESLSGFRVGVKSGDNVINLLKEKGIDSYVEYNSYEAIAEAAMNQDIVVFIIDEPAAMYYLYKLGIQNKYNKSEPLYTGEFHRAVQEGNQELLNIIEDGFSQITNNEYKNIDQKWIGTSQISVDNIRVFVVTFLIAIGVVTVLLIWSITLDKRVKAKTIELSNTLQKYRDSEAKYKNLINKLEVGVVVFASVDEIEINNKKAEDLLSMIDRRLLETSVNERIKLYVNEDEESISMEEIPTARVFSTGEAVHDYTLGIYKNNDDIVWTKIDAVPEFDSNGKISKVIVTVVDITERKKDQKKLQESENRLNAFIKAIPDLFFLFDYNGVFIDFITEDENSLYYNPQDFLGKKVSDIFNKDISEKVHRGIKKLRETGVTQTIEYMLRVNDYEGYYEARLVLCGKDRILALIRDITMRKESEQKIYLMSIHDTLTGLYNRNYFENQIEKYHKENKYPTGIVICDIDGLKLINDTLGHSTGDEYLRLVANTLKTCFREDDVVARYGGDEFAVLMRKTTINEIESIKDKIHETIKVLNTQERIVPISMSLGYAVSGDQNIDLKELSNIADDMMYREKLHHQQSQKSKTIDMLTKMLEIRDFITEGHGERMQDLCCRLAKAACLPDNEIKDMSIFAQFHDIGKVGIPDSILFKPGKLTDEEMSEMRRHPEIGYRIAEASPDLSHISDWILKHHEWYNGEGYPFGIKGREIPIQCRILSIVDAYDAMTSNRPYRNAMQKETAFQEIKKFSGIQFDPSLVELFFSII